MQLPIISFDVETRASLDLKKVGASAYIQHYDTDVFCFAYVSNAPSSIVSLWEPEQPVPDDIIDHIEKGGFFSGWNVLFFDRLAWDHILVKRHGFPSVKRDKWLDSMQLAAMANLPRGLDTCAKAVGVTFVGDLKDNARIARITNKIRTPVMTREDRVWLASRCLQDVRMEEAIFNALPEWVNVSPWDKIREVDCAINDRGVLVDIETASKLKILAEQELEYLDAKMKKLTNGKVEKTSTIEQLKRWLLANGVPVPKKGENVGGGKDIDDNYEEDSEDETQAKTDYRLRNKDIESLLGKYKFSMLIEDVLQLRLDAAKVSTKKLQRLLASVNGDGRLKNALALGGAQATMRWSSPGVQVHNLPRDVINKKLLDAAIEDIRTKPIEYIRMIWGPVLPFASKMLRRLFYAEDGNIFYYGDYSQIEARITAWLAGQKDVLDAFEAGIDLYKQDASRIFGVPVEEISSDGEKRQVGKAARLFLGFAAGPNAFIPTAMNYGVRLRDAEAKDIVAKFRENNKETVAFWDAITDTAIQAVCAPQRTFSVPPLHNISWKYDGQCLFMKLPSGRLLRYWSPQLEQGVWPDGNPKSKPDLTALVMKGRSVTRRTLWRGLLTENAVQAIAADFLANGLNNLELNGFPVVLHVHDAIAAEVSKNNSNLSLESFKYLMNLKPDWGIGLPLSAKVEESVYFG